MKTTSQLNALSDARGFIVVYPEDYCCRTVNDPGIATL